MRGFWLVTMALMVAASVAAAPFPNLMVPTYGSVIVFGDDDYLPAPNVAQVPVSSASIKEINAGAPGDATDNCFYYSPHAGGIRPGDLRLTECIRSPSFTVVDDRDATEIGRTGNESRVQAIVWQDTNESGRYDAGDAVYLTTNAANLSATYDEYNWTLRLTDTANGSLGSLVLPGDPESLLNPASFHAFPPSGGFALLDLDLNGALGGDDKLYFVGDPVEVGDRLPLFSLRLFPESGTQVLLGDSEARPAPAAAGESETLTVNNVKQTERGSATSVVDNCFYYSPNPGPIQIDDLRLSRCGDHKAGTLVDRNDTDEVGTPALADGGFAKVVYLDIDQDGVQTGSDWLYLTSSAVGILNPSLAPTVWTIRLTGTDKEVAGTFVEASSPEAGQPASDVAAGSGIALCDENHDGLLSPGDRAYFTRGPTGRGKPLPIYSVRLLQSALCLPKEATIAPTQKNLDTPPSPVPGVTTPSADAGTAPESDHAIPKKHRTPAWEAGPGLMCLLALAIVVRRRRT